MNIESKKLFSDMDERGIDYVLLTGFEEGFEQREIDMWVSQKSKESFLLLLRKKGWWYRREPARLANHNYFLPPNARVNTLLDVKFGATFYDDATLKYYLAEDDVFGRRVRNGNGLYRPHGLDALLLYSAHICFAERGEIEERHAAELYRYRNIYKKEISVLEAESIVSAVEIDELSSDIPTLKTHLKAMLRPYFSTVTSSSAWLRMFFRWRIGEGVVIVFLGADGVGKTTVIRELKDILPLKSSKAYFGEKEFCLPSVHRVFKALSAQSTSFWKKRILGALYVWLLLPLELIRRRISICRYGRYKIILIDRVPGFPFLSYPLIVKYIYLMILPRPDIVVLLTGDSKVLAARKNEASPEKVKSDTKKFRAVARELRPTKIIEIDTTLKSVTETVFCVKESIFSCPRVNERLMREP